MLKQGLHKKQIKLKDRIIAKQMEAFLEEDPWQLPFPPNAHYETKELQYYFTVLTLKSISGEHANRTLSRNYGFNLPDQQTVRVRLEKRSSNSIEENNNKFTIEKEYLPALHYPNFMKRRLHKIMIRKSENAKNTKQKRRNLNQRRKLQRERGVERPKGLYLALDEHNIPYYGKEDVVLPSGENLSSYLIHDRQKKSTKTFFSYLTVYSFEKGLRQVLSFHLMRRLKKKKNWHIEPLGPVIQYLMDPILEKYKVTGFVGDGKYYNGGVIHYGTKNRLDFVIRADFTSALKEWAEKEELLTKLEDGFGEWYPDDISFKGRGYKPIKLKLCMVRRGKELVPFVLPKYSKLSPEQALMLYEERFGIESNYRELERRFGFTTSHSSQYRIGLFASSVNVFNVLMQYHERVIQGSDTPELWKLTLLDITEAFDRYLTDIAIMTSNRS